MLIFFVFLFVNVNINKNHLSNYEMNVIAHATTLALTNELMLSSLVRKCVLSKVSEVTDQFTGLLIRLSGIGIVSKSNQKPTISYETTKICTNDINSQATNSVELNELHEMDLYENIRLIKSILYDAYKHFTFVKSNTININYNNNNQHNNKDLNENLECLCVFCQSASLCCCLEQLENIAERITFQIIEIEKRRDAHSSKWFSSYRAIDHSQNIEQIKLLFPILQERQRKFFDIVSWTHLLVRNKTQHQRHYHTEKPSYASILKKQ